MTPNITEVFILADKQLQHVPREKIRDQLLEVGFDDARQADLVGGLSGGWKMKLELGRAMLYNADLLLLDEVCRLFVENCPLILMAFRSLFDSLPITYVSSVGHFCFASA